MFKRFAMLIALSLAMAACPMPRPPDGCTPGAQVCRDGAPYVCSQSTRWVAINRKCSEIGAVCCAVPSVYDARRIVYACVHSPRCLSLDAGAP
jgi:hypothetical protein